MSAELLFDLCGKLVLPAWLLLALLPKWKWTNKIVCHAWIPSLLALCYIYCLYAGWPSPEGGGFGSLKQVMILFQSPVIQTVYIKLATRQSDFVKLNNRF